MSILLLPNARDLGGKTTESGATVRTGLVYRTAALSQPEHIEHLEKLGVGNVFDLRTREERDARPNHLPAGATLFNVDMLADAPDAGAASLGRLARAVPGETPKKPMSADQLRDIFLESYASFVTLPSARTATRNILAHVADPHSGITIVHCTAGKDRTGWISALILLSLQVPWDQVMVDYLASGPAVAAMFAPYRDRLQESSHGDESSAAAIDVALGVFPEYLEAARDTLVRDYGTLDNYLIAPDGLGLPTDFRQHLEAKMLLASGQVAGQTEHD